MKLRLSSPPTKVLESSIKITGSKSESNRLLLLQALYPAISIKNLSNSDDAQVMKKGLSINHGTVDIHHAGTAMRFLTAYFATQEGKEVTLTGSQRMTERPIKVLVEALRSLEADIHYEQKEGYPPIAIKGKVLSKNEVSLPANISSQYISALLMIAPRLKEGLKMTLIGKITSVPYIKMTLALLEQIGVRTSFEKNVIQVQPLVHTEEKSMVVESDWSSASYFYSIVALSDVGTQVALSAYKENSLQGDSVLAEIYTAFGVTTTFKEHQIVLQKEQLHTTTLFEYDLSNAPDIAQTIAVSCFGLGIGCHLTGLHTLKIKETDRLEALKTELSKLGASIEVSDISLTLQASHGFLAEVGIDTYNDHRMAMAFAPLAMKIPLIVNDAGVVSKSYPDFWNDLKSLKFQINTI